MVMEISIEKLIISLLEEKKDINEIIIKTNSIFIKKN